MCTLVPQERWSSAHRDYISLLFFFLISNILFILKSFKKKKKESGWWDFLGTVLNIQDAVGGNGSREHALPLEMKLRVGGHHICTHCTGAEGKAELRISPKFPLGGTALDWGICDRAIMLVSAFGGDVTWGQHSCTPGSSGRWWSSRNLLGDLIQAETQGAGAGSLTALPLARWKEFSSPSPGTSSWSELDLSDVRNSAAESSLKSLPLIQIVSSVKLIITFGAGEIERDNILFCPSPLQRKGGYSACLLLTFEHCPLKFINIPKTLSQRVTGDYSKSRCEFYSGRAISLSIVIPLWKAPMTTLRKWKRLATWTSIFRVSSLYENWTNTSVDFPLPSLAG